MKLERLHEYVLPTVVILIGIGLAVYTGHLTGNGQTSTLATLLALLTFGASLLIMRESIWMLIPFCWALGGQIPVLPLPFAARDLVVMSVFVAYLILKAIKIVRMKPVLTATERWMFVMLLYLVTVYIRNPVGVEALGSEKVGGRPYFDVAIGCLAYWVLARSHLSPKLSRVFPLFLVASRTVETVLNFVAYRFPAAGPVMKQFYTAISTETFDATDIRRRSSAGAASTERQTYLGGAATNGILLACSYWRPLTVINPIFLGRFLIFAVSFFALLLTGFRSAVLAAIMAVAIGSYLRRGISEIVPLVIIGVPTLALILVMQGTVFELPLSAQRALSFLPGRWDDYAVAEAKASTEWRVYMWKVMLTEDKYIQSKWFGDGFGFTLREYETMLAGEFTGDTADQQENFLITGGVHSGPLSTIRYVGYVGFAIYIIVMALLARDAWRLARRALGTPYQALAFFIGIPIIWEPFSFLLVFGGYEGALPTSLFSLGMLKLLGNSLDAYEGKETSPDEEPQPQRREGRAGTRPALAGVGGSESF